MIPHTLVAADFIGAASPPLADHEIHLWFFPHWEKMPGAATSPPVRALLAAYLDRSIENVRIEYGEYGKPRVADAGLEFNLSHTGPALLLAASRGIALGVDLESTQRKTRSASELARRFFAPAEAAALETLPQSLRQNAFLRLWCAKEAVLKAHGRGIGYGLDRAQFAIDDVGTVAPAAGNHWQLLPLAPAPAYLGALAWCGPVSRVHAFVAKK